MLSRFSGIALIGVMLCASGGCTVVSRFQAQQTALPVDSVLTAEPLPVDPWSLGPDVFAIADSSLAAEKRLTGEMIDDENEPVELPEPKSVETAVIQSSEVRREPLIATVQPRALPTTAAAPAETEPLTSYYTIQVGTFIDRAKAQDLASRASNALGLAGYIQFDSPFYRLRFGELGSREQADSLHRVAMSRGFYDARVIKIDQP
ncbi:MAG: SPOR domain-containing protein [bacterium]|nr:SPOR domain-containing protein [bacterium]